MSEIALSVLFTHNLIKNSREKSPTVRNLIPMSGTWIWESEGSGEILYGGMVSVLLSGVLQTHQAL